MWVFAIWLVSLGVGMPVLLYAHLGRIEDADVVQAIRRSGIALAPSVIPIGHYTVWRLTGYSLSGPAVGGLLLLGSVAGLPLIVASFLDAPVTSMAQGWNVARLSHVVGWASGLIIAVGHILDV